MSWRRTVLIAGQDLRILRRDPVWLILTTLIPLFVMSFAKPAARAALLIEGKPGANGAEQAVPGMAVLFALYVATMVGAGIFREHGWNTWDRLRASRVRPAEIMVGKVVVPLLCLAVQFVMLLGLGGLLYGLHVAGSRLALVAVASALAVCLVSLGLAVSSVCRTVMQLNAAANLGVLLLGGLGGALMPLSTLPAWARAIAPAFPTYWAMRGFRSVILNGADLQGVLGSVGVLLAFAAGFLLIALASFRVENAKKGWA